MNTRSPLALYGTVLRVFDSDGKHLDRYTILPPRWAGPEWQEQGPSWQAGWQAIGSSEHPFHPQGFGMHVTALPGPHLGRRIKWADLPEDVQRFAHQAFPEFAP